MSHKNPALTVWKSETQIKTRVEELARRIQKDLNGEELHVLGILRGGFIFMADLVRALDLPVCCHFINLYYKDSEPEDNQIKEISETTIYPADDLSGKNVLLISTVLDTGVIADHLLNHIRLQGARSVRVAVLIDKAFMRRVDLKADYVAFESFDNDFVFGYGLDYREKYRNLPYLAKFR